MRAWDSTQATVMPWLCPRSRTQPALFLATIVMKTCLQTTLVEDVMKCSTVKKNWPITKELFIQSCVTYISNSLLTVVHLEDTFGKNTWIIDVPANVSALFETVNYMPVRQGATTAILKIHVFIPVSTYLLTSLLFCKPNATYAKYNISAIHRAMIESLAGQSMIEQTISDQYK